jgi:SAM-dependent methyltransferase
MIESTTATAKTIKLRQEVDAWYGHPLGKSLLACEAERLRDLLPGLFATSVLQLGRMGGIELFESCSAPRRILLDTALHSGDSSLRGLAETLPFDQKSIDLVLLPHTMDFCLDPHQVLREVERVLTPEGHVVILGFNPLSLWGLKRALIRPRRRQVPWKGHFISLYRMKDWLKLLQFEITHGSMLFYRPPFQKPTTLDRFRLMDKMGDRWWPMMAGVYLLVAKKRVGGMTPIRPRWKLNVVSSGNDAPEAATRGIAAKHAGRKRASG